MRWNKNKGVSLKEGGMHHNGNGQARHLGASSTRAQVLIRCSAAGRGPGAGRVETSIAAAGSGGRGHKLGHNRRSARAPAVSTGEGEPRR
jgi:hypothetical protein